MTSLNLSPPLVPRYVEDHAARARAMGFEVLIRVATSVYFQCPPWCCGLLPRTPRGPDRPKRRPHLLLDVRGNPRDLQTAYLPPRCRFPRPGFISYRVPARPTPGGGSLTAHAEDDFTLSLDFGEEPAAIGALGDIQIIKFSAHVEYHGHRQDLVAAGVCEASRLNGRRYFKWGDSGQMWSREPQPDGTIVYGIEFESAFWERQARVKEFVRAIASREKEGARSALRTTRPGRPLLRLVVDNTPRGAPLR